MSRSNVNATEVLNRALEAGLQLEPVRELPDLSGAIIGGEHVVTTIELCEMLRASGERLGLTVEARQDLFFSMPVLRVFCAHGDLWTVENWALDEVTDEFVASGKAFAGIEALRSRAGEEST